MYAIEDNKLFYKETQVNFDVDLHYSYLFDEFYVPRYTSHEYFCVDECDFEDSYLEEVPENEWKEHPVLITRGYFKGYGCPEIVIWDSTNPVALKQLEVFTGISHKVNLRDSIALDTNKAGLFISVLTESRFSVKSYKDQEFQDLM